MDQNGFNNNNFFEGPVFIDGNTDIDGNLAVSGTYPGGGGGGSVNNPMTEDLQAGGYAIFNLSEITGHEGVLSLSSTVNLQDNNIEGVNTIKIEKITTKNPEDYVIDCDGKILQNADSFILNNGLAFSSSIVPVVNHVLTVESPGTLIGYKNAVFNPVEDTVNMNSKNIDNCHTLDVRYIKDNTAENIVRFHSIVYTVQPLYCFEDIVLNFKRIYYCNSLIAAHNQSGLGLDMIPATAGLPGQVLARDPNYNPNNPNTYKLVWVNQSSGGGVTNPMTTNLSANDFNIYLANILECKNLLIMPTGNGIACNGGGSAVPITWVLAIKKSTSPFYQTFNTDYITPQTIEGVTIDSKWQDGTTDTKISLQTPILNINNSTNLSPTNITITGNIQITQGSGYIHGNNLIVRGRTSANVPTNLTLEGVTTAINSTTLNITSTANVIAGNTNFTGTIRTNFIDTHTGGNIAILQNLTMADGKRLNANSIYTNSIRPYTNNELAITGLQSDNKTLSNITLSAPVISLNNIFDTLNPGTAVNIDGTLSFNIEGKINNVSSLTGYSGGVSLNLDLIPATEGLSGQALIRDPAYNPVNPSTHKLKWASVLTNPLIATLDCATQWIDNVGRITVSEIYSQYPDVQLHANLTLYGSINMSGTIANLTGINNNAVNGSILIQSPTLNLASTTTTISGTTANLNFNNVNISNNLNVLTNRSPSIGVRTTLFKTFGAMPVVDLNTLTPVKVNTTIANQKGTNLIPANGFVNGDKFIITMYGILTTLGSGSLNISLYVGASLALNFNVINVGISNQGAKFTFEIDCTTSGSNVNLGNSTAFLSVERFNSSIRFATPVQTNLINNQLANNTFDIHMYQTSAQVSSFTPLSYTIEQM